MRPTASSESSFASSLTKLIFRSFCRFFKFLEREDVTLTSCPLFALCICSLQSSFGILRFYDFLHDKESFVYIKNFDLQRFASTNLHLCTKHSLRYIIFLSFVFVVLHLFDFCFFGFLHQALTQIRTSRWRAEGRDSSNIRSCSSPP